MTEIEETIVASLPTADVKSESAETVDSTADDVQNGGAAVLSTPVVVTPLSRCGSVGFTLGTPLALELSVEEDCQSAIDKLPDRSSFAVGVSDHILYENLPNATGTFQRLRSTLRKLRETGQQSKSDDSL